MKKYNLTDYIGGWFIGDFDPSIVKTSDFEVSIKKYKSGDSDFKHYHKISEEITVIVSGIAKMNDIIYHENDILLISKNEPTDFHALTDCVTCVVKIPSSLNDKYQYNATQSEQIP
jgi:TPP-dependent 2-oxoacid decarboxylase